MLAVGAMSVVNAKLLRPAHSSDTIVELAEVSTVRVIAVRQLQHTTSHISVRETGVLLLTWLIELEGSNKCGAYDS